MWFTFINSNFKFLFYIDYDEEEFDEVDDERIAQNDEVEGGTYEYFYNKYDDKQKLLVPDHEYKYEPGEHKLDPISVNEEIYLTED